MVIPEPSGTIRRGTTSIYLKVLTCANPGALGVKFTSLSVYFRVKLSPSGNSRGHLEA